MVNWILQKIIGTQNERTLKRLRPLVAQINALEPTVAQWPDQQFRERTEALRREVQEAIRRGATHLNELRELPADVPPEQLRDARERQKKARHRFETTLLDRYLPEAFAMVREASKRTTSMRHFDMQLIGGMMLHHGAIAEMATGEGKTLVATLAAYLNALTGSGVHIVTVNDYLARRDRAWMGPIYEFLGLTVGAIQHDFTDEERQRAYACDITYGTNNELGFDYLRDNMKAQKETLVHRGFHFAIVDEVDSILVDEARTPLIISGPAEESTELYYQLDGVARRLAKERDFTVDEKAHAVALTEEGIAKAEGLLGVQNLYDFANQRYVHHLTKALEAHQLRRCDADYVVKDGEILIVDEFTGRLMPGRRWSDGLHQAIEAKEGVRIQQENQTLATITFQNYFRMYDKLAGMTGTALTEAQEFKEIYGLDVVVIPTNRPLIRTTYADQVYRTEEEKFIAAVQEIVHWYKQKRPLLVGTIAIDKSERLSAMLSSPQAVLEALQRQCTATVQAVSAVEQKRVAWLTADLQHRLRGLLEQPARMTLADVQPLVTSLETAAPNDALTAACTRIRDLADVVETIRAGIPHRVLNAKYHELEAHIIAQAGRLSAITIATNMAGRGTDILLGGNPDFLADDLLRQRADGGETITSEERQRTLAEMRQRCRAEHDQVVALGGLHVIGTERHEARRIDNQLRGRAGRQGDPGASRFYLSLEDDLMRIFAPDRIKKLMDFFKWEEGIPIEHPLLTRSIETAQRRVETHNFEIRKQLLKYDNVMNRQREVIYDERRRLLEADSLASHLEEIMVDVTDQMLDRYAHAAQTPDAWDLPGLHTYMQQRFGVECPWLAASPTTREQLAEQLARTFRESYEAKVRIVGTDAMRFHERAIFLHVMDAKWKDHLYGMDALREGIGFRGYGQRDPLVEYQHEAFAMFQTMVELIKEDSIALLLRFQVGPTETVRLRSVFDGARQQLLHPEVATFEAAAQRTAGSPPPRAATTPAMSAAVTRVLGGGRPATVTKVGRNDPCPCGSGRKYKKCHGQ